MQVFAKYRYTWLILLATFFCVGWSSTTNAQEQEAKTWRIENDYGYGEITAIPFDPDKVKSTASADSLYEAALAGESASAWNKKSDRTNRFDYKVESPCLIKKNLRVRVYLTVAGGDQIKVVDESGNWSSYSGWWQIYTGPSKKVSFKVTRNATGTLCNESKTLTATGYTSGLKAPSNVTASANGSDGLVKLSWSKGTNLASNEYGYYVYKNGGFLVTLNSSTTSYTGTTTPNTTDTWGVATRFYGKTQGGVYNPGQTSARQEKNATTAVYKVPANFVATDDTIVGYVGLSWDQNSDYATHTRVYRDDEVLKTILKTQATYNDHGAIPGVQHNYQVRSYNSASGSESEPANEVGSAFLFAASDGNENGRVKLEWTNIPFAEYASDVKIDRGNGNPVGVFNIAQGSVDDKEGIAGKLYEYKITVLDPQRTEKLEHTDYGFMPANGQVRGTVKTPGATNGGGVSEVVVSAMPTQDTLSKALYMDGVNGYAQFKHVPKLALTGSKTIEFWTKLNSMPTDLFSFVAKIFGGPSTMSYGIDLNSTGNFRFTTAGQGNQATSTTTVETGKWYHIAGVQDTDSATIKIYINGQLENSQPANTADLDFEGPLMFGRDESGHELNGILDEVRIWNIARSEAEIEADMQRVLTGDETGLVGYWPFNNDVPNIAGDLSKNGGNHGVIVDGAAYTENVPGLKYSALTDDRGEGSYKIEGVYYGTENEFKIFPYKEDHGFDSPDTLYRTLENTPPDGWVATANFVDTTSFSISGKVSFFSDPSCGAQNVQILVDGVVAGVSNTDGTFSVSVPQAGDYTIKPVLGEHEFDPAETTITVQNNTDGLIFLDKATSTLSGSALSGCLSFIGAADISINSLNGCISRIVTTNGEGLYSDELPAQKYVIELQSIAHPDSQIILSYFKKDTLDLTFSDSTHNYIYHAPPQISVTGPFGFGCNEFADVPVMRQFLTDTLLIEIFERYVYNGVETTCPIDSGQLVIDDRISDDAPEQTIDFKDGLVKYPLTPGLPNILADNPNHPFQKVMNLTANVERYSEMHDFWALVEGHKPRPGEPFSTVSPELPLMILRDPPGDQSYSFLEKETSRTLGVGLAFEAEGSVQVFDDVKVGGGAQIPGVGATGGFVRVGKSLEVGGSIATEASLDLTITSRERLLTSDDEQITGTKGDVFVGGAYNITYGITDVLKYTNCGVDLSQSIVWGSNDFATRYFYTESYIRGSLIPELKFLADNAGSADKSATFLDAIEVWQQVLDINEQYKADAPVVKQNISFSGNLGVEESETVTQTISAQIEFNMYIESSVAVSGGAKAGDFNEAEGGVKVRTRYSLGASLSASKTKTNTVGYFLGDDDEGDDFTVNIKGDPVYGTPIFQLIGGTSSNPWEGLPSQPRDGLFLSIDPTEQIDIPAGQAAVYELRLFNTSPSNETREYMLSLIQSSNPGGARLRIGDQFVENLAYTIPAQDFQEVTLDVARLDGHPFEYSDLQLRMFAEQDPQFADTVSLSASFIKPCSEITLVRPESNWTITQTTDEIVDVVLTDYDDTDPNLNAIRLEYSEDEVNWKTITTFSSTELIADSIKYEWDASQRPNGTYVLRAVAECTFGENFSFMVNGFIDRSSWSSDLILSDASGQGSWAKMSYGQSSMATSGLDVELGESELPPFPPQGVFYAGFDLPVEPGVASRADFRSSEGLGATWTFTFQPGPGGYPMMFNWDPASLPAGDFFLQDNITGAIINVNMKDESSFLLDNSAISSLSIEFNSPFQCQQITPVAGWNILSVPLESNDMFKNTIFPNATSSAFAFDGGYREDQLLQSGFGYWMKFASTDTLEICGRPSNTSSVAVKEGWNIIGPFDAPVRVSEITTVPAGIITSQFFGYNSGYQVADILESGKGYWVQVSQNGLLDLTASEVLSKASVATIPKPEVDASWGRIIVTDSEGNEVLLYAANSKINHTEYALPPTPPAGVFDARFASGSFVTHLDEVPKSIQISSMSYPIRISADGLNLRVKDRVTGKMINKLVKNGEVMEILNPNLTSIEVAKETLPEKFELFQNYPNPFNPSTTIKFNLPKNSRVRLAIYNFIGQVVAELVDEELEAGSHKIEFNAANYATGLYLYKLKTSEFTSVKKMLLVK